jgi:hypothetical protein
MQRLSAERIVDACLEAGVRLGRYDVAIIDWLAGFEPQQAQVFAELIRRATTS